MESGSVPKRRGGRQACVRCHRRKQRCIGSPTCANCQSAQVSCLRREPPNSRRFAGWSREELLDALENGLPTLRPDDLDEEQARSPQEPGGIDGLTPSSAKPGLYGVPSPSSSSIPDVASGIRDANSSVALPAWEGDPQPSASIRTLNWGTLLHADGKSGMSALPELPAPNSEVGSQLLLSYFENMHRRLPFWDFGDIVNMAKTMPKSGVADAERNLERTKAHLVFAIGARIAKLSQDRMLAEPERHFSAALALMPPFDAVPMIQNIESGMLIVLYQLRTYVSSDVWYIIGHLMRMVVDVGMHREIHYQLLDARTASLRRRLFWTAYIMERNVAWALKRPVSISDHDIDTRVMFDAELPSEQISSPDGGLGHIGVLRPLNLQTFEFAVNLSRIRSRIHSTVHRIGRNESIVLNEVKVLLHELQEFEQSLPAFQDMDSDFVQLHLSGAARELIEPIIGIMPVQSDLTIRLLHSCGVMCQMFKRMRIRKSLVNSVIMIRSVFTAGMTIW